jgi:hypothetical protein
LDLDEWTKTLPQPWTAAMEATIFAAWFYDHLPPRVVARGSGSDRAQTVIAESRMPFRSSAGNQNSRLCDIMEERRKDAFLFAATFLSARKLIETIESDTPNWAKEYFADVQEVAFVLERIDMRWPR